jgi:hypothetical protein
VLEGKGTRRINVILAAPNSLVFRFGRTYDRNHPPLVVWQYEREQAISYPWGILMPPGGRGRASVAHSQLRHWPIELSLRTPRYHRRGAAEMKRDMDLIRDLLLRLEAMNLRAGAVALLRPGEDEIAFPGHDADVIGFHLDLLREIGRLRAQADAHR